MIQEARSEQSGVCIHFVVPDSVGIGVVMYREEWFDEGFWAGDWA